MSNTFKTIAAELGELVTAKNLAYGNSFAKCGGFLRLLYPNGIQPDQYEDCLCMCRIFDKQMRIATHKTALGESPYRDIAGYGILGIAKDQEMAARGAFLNGAVHGEPRFVIKRDGKGCVESAGVVYDTPPPEGASTCTHFDGTVCLANPDMGANFDCYNCPHYPRVSTLKPHVDALAPIFSRIVHEYDRSLKEHAPWEDAGHSPDTMLAVIKAELAEVELALSMGDYAETVRELVHVANVAVKAIAELDRRGTL